MMHRRPLAQICCQFNRYVVDLIKLVFIAASIIGCDAAVETAGNAMFSLVDEIEERNANALQARINLKPRSEMARSEKENCALRIANDSIASSTARVKEAFCGSPPDLSHLPPEFFRFQPSAYIPEDTPEECRAAVDRRFPNLVSCYLIFDSGSTAYINCYNVPDSMATVACMSVKKLMWEILWDKELRRDCPEVDSETGA